jgi:hypothetical protein
MQFWGRDEMNRIKIIAMAGLASLPLAGCATGDQPTPMVFGRTQSVGIGVQGSAVDAGGSVTLGFNDRNIAIVPTTTMQGGNIRSISTGPNGAPFEDSLSVLGQFEASGSAKDVGASLGTFFSTGLAARHLAEGFKARLRGQAAGTPEPAPNPE